MTADYPKEDQNPKTVADDRPEDQPKPQVRVPKQAGAAAPEPEERAPTTQESPEAGQPHQGANSAERPL